MDYDTKSAPIASLDDDDASGVCVFATLFPAIDSDGDVLMPGSVGNHQVVPIIPAHDWESAPLGKAWLYEQGGEAKAAFKLNQTSGGREWWQHLKFDASDGSPCQEFSIGFKVRESSFGQHEGRRVRFLEELEIFELSPVLKAAGAGTRLTCLGSGCKSDMSSVERTLEKVGGYLLKDNFEEMTQFTYRQVYAVDDAFFDSCHILAKLASQDLGIEEVDIIKFFRSTMPGEEADFCMRMPIIGQADGDCIWIRTDLRGEKLIECVAHECFHIAQPDAEHEEAYQYGRQFAAKFGHLTDAPLYVHLNQDELNLRTIHTDAPQRSSLINLVDGAVYERVGFGWEKRRRWNYS